MSVAEAKVTLLMIGFPAFDEGRPINFKPTLLRIVNDEASNTSRESQSLLAIPVRSIASNISSSNAVNAVRHSRDCIASPRGQLKSQRESSS